MTVADVVQRMESRKEMLENAIWSANLSDSTDHLKAQVEILDEFITDLKSSKTPVRNCDLYATSKEAWLAWEKHCEETGTYEEVDEVDLYNEWLFSKAKGYGYEQ